MGILKYKFNLEYAIMLSAKGEGEITESDFDICISEIYSTYKKYYCHLPRDVSLSIENSLSNGLDNNCTSIDTSFLEKLDNLKELILPDSFKEIKMTPKLKKILKTNNCLIRGSFDSFAEQFALENELHFRPNNFEFVNHEIERVHETTSMTMEFKRDGSVRIKESINSPGSSAGHYFGENFYYDMKKNFYKTETAEKIAINFRKIIYDAVIEDGRLAKFLEKAKSHKIYMRAN